MLDRYEGSLKIALLRPLATVLGITGIFVLSLALYPLIGKAYFPRTDPGQFVISVKAPSGTRLELTEQLVGQVEDIVRDVVPKQRPQNHRLQHRHHAGVFIDPQLPTPVPSTAFVQVGLNDGHELSSFDYMNLVRARLRTRTAAGQRLFPDRRLGGRRHQPGHARAAGYPGQRHGHEGRPRHRQRRSRNRRARCPASATCWCRRTWIIRRLKIDIDRERASELGLSAKEVDGQPHHRADLRRHDRAELLD